ncbi:GGDEF domain-containing response regulator [Desulfobacter latus]|uniref:diguanylate cyclase n=1 Tax=Desulfobacter latus TaxID=2292 RepID=A0A850T4A0_9BACT|nr:GGDEF domain-containing response regulator [Desulfobacter latus]NWH06593.1 GGDEF domain-containing response regulator [Desulfobacter latus]
MTMNLSSYDKMLLSQEKQHKQQLILIVGNKKFICIVNKIFKKKNIIIKDFQSGKDAISFADQNKIDMAFIEIELSDTPGFEVCRKIKKKNTHIPVIFMGRSRQDILDNKMKAFSLGVDDFVSPETIKTKELFIRCNALLKRKISIDNLFYQAIIDPVSGLYNRSYFNFFINNEIKRAEREQSTLSILMLDVDNFKIFNDKWGHAKGDDILRKVGTVINSKIRDYDIPARTGGDEFAIVLPGCNLNLAFDIAQRIRSSILNYNISVSIGVSHCENNYNADTLLEKVDKGLYIAKDKGKNRVCVN